MKFVEQKYNTQIRGKVLKIWGLVERVPILAVTPKKHILVRKHAFWYIDCSDRSRNVGKVAKVIYFNVLNLTHTNFRLHKCPH